MTITILSATEYIAASYDMPVAGRSYVLEDNEAGTSAQNRAFHALLQEYWRSGAHSYPAKSFSEFKGFIKKNLGVGYESYDYADIVHGRVEIFRGVKQEDIPLHVWSRRHYAVRGNLKSWSDYTKKERRETMDRLISEMLQAGVNSKKFQEIMAGLEGVFA